MVFSFFDLKERTNHAADERRIEERPSDPWHDGGGAQSGQDAHPPFPLEVTEQSDSGHAPCQIRQDEGGIGQGEQERERNKTGSVHGDRKSVV